MEVPMKLLRNLYQPLTVNIQYKKNLAELDQCKLASKIQAHLEWVSINLISNGMFGIESFALSCYTHLHFIIYSKNKKTPKIPGSKRLIYSMHHQNQPKQSVCLWDIAVLWFFAVLLTMQNMMKLYFLVLYILPNTSKSLKNS